jgi:hypothetical protein
MSRKVETFAYDLKKNMIIKKNSIMTKDLFSNEHIGEKKSLLSEIFLRYHRQSRFMVP